MAIHAIKVVPIQEHYTGFSNTNIQLIRKAHKNYHLAIQRCATISQFTTFHQAAI